MTPPIASPASQTITTVVFGIVATIISTVTVWQSYKAWKIWYDYHHRQAEVEQDLDSRDHVPRDWVQGKLTNTYGPDIELGSRTNNSLQASPTGRSEGQEAAAPALVDGGSGPINQAYQGPSPVAGPAAGRGLDGIYQ